MAQGCLPLKQVPRELVQASKKRVVRTTLQSPVNSRTMNVGKGAFAVIS